MIRPVTRALVSVSAKEDLVPFARRLTAAGVEIVSSGGTASTLADAGVPVTTVADVTGFPEILGGRVKTLHPRIHAGILARTDDPEHRTQLDEEGIEPFQLVVVDLYPFETTVVTPGVTEGEAIEQIDIGGPAMIRAAAKNHDHLGVVVSADDYYEVATAVENGGLDDELRRRLAAAAFARTAAYDAAVTRWMHRGQPLPPRLVTILDREGTLRYGENPHQAAAIYRGDHRPAWWADARTLQGKPMSFNNYADAEAAWRLVDALGTTGAVVVKHTNACGAAVAPGIADAFARAWACDPLSAFGGVIALNAPLDGEVARRIVEHFVEVVIAPEVADEAVPVLAAKRNLRVLVAPPPGDGDLDMRGIEGGLLVQERDRVAVPGSGALPDGWTVEAGDPPGEATTADLGLAWVVAAHTKSNAVVIAGDGAAVGVGAGDQSRVGAAERALGRAGERARGAVAASDAFLPFRDTLDTLADAGVGALVEPGGSKRDGEVIAAAEERGMTLLFTGTRHFRH